MPKNNSMMVAKLPALPRPQVITLKDQIRIHYRVSAVFVTLSAVLFLMLLGVPLSSLVMNVFQPSHTEQVFSLVHSEVILACCLAVVTSGGVRADIQTITALRLTRRQALRNSLRFYSVVAVVQAVIFTISCLLTGRSLRPYQMPWSELLMLIAVGLLWVIGVNLYQVVFQYLINTVSSSKTFKLAAVFIFGVAFFLIGIFNISFSHHDWILGMSIYGIVIVIAAVTMLVVIRKDSGHMMRPR